MVDDEPDVEPEVEDGELDDDEMPFSLDEPSDELDDDDGDDEDDGEIDLDVALAMSGDEDEDESASEDDDEDDEDDEEPVREGEFVCNGCHMVFRLTAMANQKARLCRDCA